MRAWLTLTLALAVLAAPAASAHRQITAVAPLAGVVSALARTSTPPQGALSCNPPIRRLPCAHGRRLGVAYRFDLHTHCGILDEWFDGHLRLVLVQPEPRGDTDSVAYDRELVLTFSEPVSAANVEILLTTGLDT